MNETVYGPGNNDYGRDKWLSDETATLIKNMLMKPTIGRIVIYYVPKAEQAILNNYQAKAPAIITAVWSDICVNLKVLHDGYVDRWKTSICQYDDSIGVMDELCTENTWDWPVIE